MVITAVFCFMHRNFSPGFKVLEKVSSNFISPVFLSSDMMGCALGRLYVVARRTSLESPGAAVCSYRHRLH